MKQQLQTSNVTSITEVRSTNACLFAGTWRPLVSVITTFYYVVIIFHRRVGIMPILCATCVINFRASSSSPRLPLC